MQARALMLAGADLMDFACHGPHEGVLGGAVHGAGPGAGDGGMPLASVPMPVLAGQAVELWQAAGPLREGECEGVRFRCNEELIFAVLQWPQAPGEALEQLSERAYRAMLNVLQAQGFPHLVRCWNYMADINADECQAGEVLERYRRFNIGRAAAFADITDALLATASPAACALGMAEGPLTLYCLASRRAPINIENPRQVSAYRYPERYGPRSPTFSRAGMLPLSDGGEVLFISGTASIVGHESLHVGSVAAQTQESLRNIAVLIEAANARSTHRFGMQSLHYKVFVRHAADLPCVQAVMQETLGAVQALYLQADVCRSELLVEIEATGFAGGVS